MFKILAALFAVVLLFPNRVGADVVIKNGESIAFLGDSITERGFTDKANGYVNLVIDGLKQAGVTAIPIPAGVGGNTSADMLARLDRDVLSKHPVWMTLNSGTNDAPRLSVDEFTDNITKIVDQATAAGIKVILMTTTVKDGENMQSPEGQKRLAYCAAMAKLAKDRNLILVDLYAVTGNAEKAREKEMEDGLILTVDGTHLNGVGNQTVAAEILRVLGVSDSCIATSRKIWADYPNAIGMPEVSVNDYLKLKAMAVKNGKTVDEQVAALLTASAEQEKK